jgi:(2Fe-2S) ferredoxin
MCQEKLRDLEANVVYQGVTYTVAQAIYETEKGRIVAEGISRRSGADAPNPQVGIEIALGRAKRALWNKINHKGNHGRMKG